MDISIISDLWLLWVISALLSGYFFITGQIRRMENVTAVMADKEHDFSKVRKVGLKGIALTALLGFIFSISIVLFLLAVVMAII